MASIQIVDTKVSGRIFHNPSRRAGFCPRTSGTQTAGASARDEDPKKSELDDS